ncbi:MAG: precorrin-6A/cobalt-precorrin-6A reductase [Eubacterium sp.]
MDTGEKTDGSGRRDPSVCGCREPEYSDACDRTQTEYIRLIRQASDLENLPGIVSFPDCKKAAEWLNSQQGNVLLTTGAKELPTFVSEIEQTDRIYARVLLQESVFSDMERLGLLKKQMICMQGPFSKELNTAMLRQLDAAFLVTKEAGAAGGFMEKVEAAREAGATCVVIRRPVQETGYSQEKVEQLLEERWSREMPEILECKAREEFPENQEAPQNCRQVTLLGIGMGDPATMTLEAVRGLRRSRLHHRCRPNAGKSRKIRETDGLHVSE